MVLNIDAAGDKQAGWTIGLALAVLCHSGVVPLVAVLRLTT